MVIIHFFRTIYIGKIILVNNTVVLSYYVTVSLAIFKSNNNVVVGTLSFYNIREKKAIKLFQNYFYRFHKRITVLCITNYGYDNDH